MNEDGEQVTPNPRAAVEENDVDAISGDSHGFSLDIASAAGELADKMYGGNEVAFREVYTNAIAAIKRRRDDGKLEEGEGLIEVNIYEDETTTLEIIDNGDGMTREKIDNVVTQLFESENVDDGDVPGMFGVGFLSLFMFVGLDGAFVMNTNSYKGDGPLCGIWTISNGFTEDEEGLMDEYFDNGEYGTRFLFRTKDDLQPDQIEDWVYKFSQWSRVPILYQRYKGGSQVKNDELGGVELEDIVSGDATAAAPETSHLTESVRAGDVCIKYEDEFVEAVATNRQNERGKITLLLDVPIERNTRSYLETFTDVPVSDKNVIVRLKSENRPIVDSENGNEGLNVTLPSDYRSRSKEQKSNYIPESEVSRGDVVAPEPTSSRDNLRGGEGFWEWLNARLGETYREDTAEVFERVSSLEDVLDLDSDDFGLLRMAIDNAISEQFLPENCFEAIGQRIERLDEGEDDGVSDHLQDRFDVEDLQTSFVRDLLLAMSSVDMAGGDKGRGELLTVLSEVHDSDGELWYGKTINNAKMRAALDDCSDSVVISVETEAYDFLDRIGGKPLKSISKSSIESGELDVSDDVEELFESSSSSKAVNNSVKSRNLKIYYCQGRRGPRSATISASNLVDKCVDNDRPKISNRKLGRVVAIPRPSTHSISSYKEHANRTVSFVSVTSREWDFLRGTQNVCHIDNYIQEARETELHTSLGKREVKEVIQDDSLSLVAHRIRDKDAYETLSQEVIAHEIASAYQSEEAEQIISCLYSSYVSSRVRRGTEDLEGEMVYAPVKNDEFQFIKAAVPNDALYDPVNSKRRDNFVQSPQMLYLFSQLRRRKVDEDLNFFLVNCLNNRDDLEFQEAKEKIDSVMKVLDR